MQIPFPQRLSFQKVLSLGLFFVFLYSPTLVEAAEKPTKELEKAIKSGKKVILFEGKENEDFAIRSGVTVTGTSPDKAIISGDIKLENGVTLSNVTVSGKEIPITIAKGASVTLINVTVRGGKDAGIFAQEGSGTLTLKNSRVTKNRKGLYILPGKNLMLSGNVISGSSEEGLDIRAGVTGTISDNQFLNNGEGGAEIIAGSARLVIQNNTFSGNKADGLTIQSYSGSGKASGNIRLVGNTFADNRSFGLSCQSPSLGGADATFYRRTVVAIDNTFRGNKAGVIDRECGGVVNRASVQEEDVEESEVSEEELQAAAKKAFEEHVTKLHAAEYALERRLHEMEGNAFQKLLRVRLIRADEKTEIESALATLDELRESVSTFPRFEDSVSEEDRQDILIESLRRKEELQSTFHALQEKSFPRALLPFFF